VLTVKVAQPVGTLTIPKLPAPLDCLKSFSILPTRFFVSRNCWSFSIFPAPVSISVKTVLTQLWCNPERGKRTNDGFALTGYLPFRRLSDIKIGFAGHGGVKKNGVTLCPPIKWQRKAPFIRGFSSRAIVRNSTNKGHCDNGSNSVHFLRANCG